jgi:hypothetical protein
VGQAGLSQAGWPVEHDMVEGFPPAFGRRDGYFQVFLVLVLPDEFGQGPGAETGIEWCVLGAGLTRDNASYCLTPSKVSDKIRILVGLFFVNLPGFFLVFFLYFPARINIRCFDVFIFISWIFDCLADRFFRYSRGYFGFLPGRFLYTC